MTGIENLQYSIRCRCCLSQTSIYLDIFTSNKELNIAIALKDICGIDISSQDNLPHVICASCLEILKICHNFRMKTQLTNQTLHNVLEGNITVVQEDDSPVCDGVPDDASIEMKIESIEDLSASLTCPYCLKMFVHRRNLQIHKQRHFMVGKYGCQFCTQRFHTKFDLLRHSSTFHLEEKPYQCVDCMKRFPTKPELNRHQKLLHNPIKSFSCSECGKLFKLKANAKQHIHLVHSKDRNHICDLCGKSFAFASKLRVHTKSKCERPIRIKEEYEVESCSELVDCK